MSEGRGRLAFAAGATAILTAAIVVVVISGSSGEEEGPADPCRAIWNDDPLARSDGVHAYEAHGYRATLLTRVDQRGDLVADADLREAPTTDARCAVVFASPQVDSEPEFGVRVFDIGRWAGLALVDRVPLDQIEAMQQDATATANTTLLPDGRLAD
jgi:hypothetical protein